MSVCIAKIIQRALFLGIGNGPLAIPRTYACPATKKGNPSDHGSEYDHPPHRKERAKLRLEHPLVRLESFTLASSTTVPKNRQVVPGPVGFGAQGVEIGFECSLLDPSATEGLDVLRDAARTL